MEIMDSKSGNAHIGKMGHCSYSREKPIDYNTTNTVKITPTVISKEYTENVTK